MVRPDDPGSLLRAFYMPSRHSSAETRHAAETICRELGVLLGRQQPHPPLLLRLPQRGGDVLRAHRLRDGQLLEVETGEGEGEPAVRLEQEQRRAAGVGPLPVVPGGRSAALSGGRARELAGAAVVAAP